MRTPVAASSSLLTTLDSFSQIQGVSHSDRQVGASRASAVPMHSMGWLGLCASSSARATTEAGGGMCASCIPRGSVGSVCASFGGSSGTKHTDLPAVVGPGHS